MFARASSDVVDQGPPVKTVALSVSVTEITKAGEWQGKTKKNKITRKRRCHSSKRRVDLRQMEKELELLIRFTVGAADPPKSSSGSEPSTLAQPPCADS